MRNDGQIMKLIFKLEKWPKMKIVLEIFMLRIKCEVPLWMRNALETWWLFVLPVW